MELDGEAKHINGLYKKMLDTKSVTVAIELGELLTTKKSGLQHGAFTPWIKDNLIFSERTAQVYMHLFNHKVVGLQTDSIKRACKAINKSKKKSPSAVLKPIELSAVLKPIEPSAVLKPIEPSAVLKPTEPSAVLKPTEPSAVLKPIEPSAVLKPTEPSAVFYFPPFSSSKEKKTSLWEIKRLEDFFKNFELPDTPINTKSGKIIDIRLYVDSYINIVRAQNGKPTYLPYYRRLIETIEILTTKKIPSAAS